MDQTSYDQWLPAGPCKTSPGFLSYTLPIEIQICVKPTVTINPIITTAQRARPTVKRIVRTQDTFPKRFICIRGRFSDPVRKRERDRGRGRTPVRSEPSFLLPETERRYRGRVAKTVRKHVSR